MATSDGDLDVRLLGPIEVLQGEQRLEIGGKRQRHLLALLALEGGRVVPTDRLVDELGAGSSAAIKVQISRLRKALGSAGPISGSAGGYRLEVPPEQVDVARFERFVVAAREHRAERPRRAAAAARAALELWRGAPFGGAGDGGVESELPGRAARLEELRLEAVELRIEAELALGASSELVAELESLVAAHPYREALWRQLMLALYRADRQADALGAYHRARRALDEELGLEPSEDLVDLEAAILRHDVAQPLPPERRHNLPATVTSFVGRRAELAEIESTLGRARLVTLTGVGGVGKTRLGLEAARAQVGLAGDGVWFVDLARLADGDLVAAEVGAAIGVPEDASTAPIERLLAHLADREALLVLDNCEHLVAACATLTARVLARCPAVRVLATSRVPLGIAGESAYGVPPMSLPAPDGDASSRAGLSGAVGAGPAALGSDAVSLFLERAGAASPGLQIDGAGAAVVDRICRDLEGLPLAIELAAARARSLALPDIGDRLRDRFRFLVSWRRVAEARHRTLREAIDWSYDLLEPTERRLLERISAFAGSFDLAAAAVVADGGDLDTLNSLERLMDASLVVPLPSPSGPTRYRLLETVRQHAAERLADGGDAPATLERHARHYTAFAIATDLAHQDGESERLAHERLATDRDNIRAALAWLHDHDEWADLVRLGEALWRYWWVRGDTAEGRAWLDRAIALRDAHAGDATGRGHRAAFGDMLRGLAGLAWAEGDLEAARTAALRAEAIFEDLDDQVGMARTWNTLGVIEHGRRDMPAARAAFERSLALFEGADLEPVRLAQLRATTMDNLGSVLYEGGDAAGATELYRAARTLHATEGKGAETAMMDLHLGRTAVTDGDLGEAGVLLESALRHYSELGFLQYVMEGIEGVGWLATARGDFATAATAMGAAGRMREQIGTPYWGRVEEKIVRYAAIAREGLGDEAFEAAEAVGRAAPERAVEAALAWLARVNAA